MIDQTSQKYSDSYIGPCLQSIYSNSFVCLAQGDPRFKESIRINRLFLGCLFEQGLSTGLKNSNQR